MLVLILALAAASVGIALTIVGVVGRRVSLAPHCRKCRYNLTGVESGRCPECGLALVPGNVRQGLRRARRAWLGAGLALVALAGAGLYRWGIQKPINWYAYYPMSWLVRQAGADDVAAVDELMARCADGRCTADEWSTIASMALVKHAASPAPPRWAAWCDRLAQMDLDGLITEDQRAQFHRQLFPFTLHVRPRIREGEPLVAQVRWKDRGSSWLPFVHGMRIRDCMVDDTPCGIPEHVREVPLPIGSRFLIGPDDELGRQDLTFDELPLAQGIHTFRCIADLTLIRKDQDRQVLGEIECYESELFASVTVLPATAEDTLMRVEDDSVRRILAEAIRPGDFCAVELDEARFWLFWLSQPPFHADRRPHIPVALKVVVRSSNGEQEALNIIEGPLYDWYDYPRWAELPMPPEREITLSLRSDADLARRTVEVQMIWDGQIELGTIPIVRGSEVPAEVASRLPWTIAGGLRRMRPLATP